MLLVFAYQIVPNFKTMINNAEDFDYAAVDFDEIDSTELYEDLLKKLKKKGETFMTTYDNYLDVMLMLSPAAVHLLTWLTMHSEMNTGKAVLQSQTLATCLKELKIVKSTFYRCLTELKELDLIKGGNAKYYINPRYVWKGTNDMRAGFMKVYPRLR